MTKTVKDLFQAEKVKWLDGARAAARKLLRYRRTITIEDVLEIHPLPTYIHRNTAGRVFQCDDFHAVGWTPSTRRVSHGRHVRVWEKADPRADVQSYRQYNRRLLREPRASTHRRC